MANTPSSDDAPGKRRPDRGSRFQRRDTDRRHSRSADDDRRGPRSDRGGKKREGERRSWDGDRRNRDDNRRKGDRRGQFDGGRGKRGDNRRGKWNDDRRGGSRHSGGDRRFKGDNRRKDRRHQKRDQRPRFNAPPIPEGITGKELPGDIKGQLRGLSPDNRERVSKHIVAAGALLDIDIDQAYEHASAAAHSAGRIGAAREALGIVAYRKGLYDEAARELRTHRRITGSDDNIALIADAERGRGRAQKALDMFAEADRTALSDAVWIELVIVAAGAHSDLGDLATARRTIEDVGFTGHKPASAVRLIQAYADLLRADGDSETADKYDKLAEVTAERAGLQDPGDDVDIIVIEEEELPESAEKVDPPESDAESQDSSEPAREESEHSIDKPAEDSDDSSSEEKPASEEKADGEARTSAGEEADQPAGASGEDVEETGSAADNGPVPIAEGNTLEDEINDEMAEIIADIDAAHAGREAESAEDAAPAGGDAEAPEGTEEAKGAEGADDTDEAVERQPSVHDEPEPGDTPPMFDL